MTPGLHVKNNIQQEMWDHYVFCLLCAYMHTINICQSVVFYKANKLQWSKQLSPTSVGIIVMPRNVERPDGRAPRSNGSEQVLNCGS